MKKPFSPKNIFTIFKRELTGYFESPVAYVFIVIFLLLQGFFTFNIGQFFQTDQANLLVFFQWHPWIFLFLIPAIGMRLWAEEFRTGTIELLLTLPVTIFDTVLGKFFAAWLFLGIALFLTFPMIITVMYLGNPDTGVIICTYTGSFLMAGAFLSICSMTSSLTKSQVISFVISIVICLFFILAGYPPITDSLSGWAPFWITDIISNFSFLTHFDAFKSGVLDLRDFIYYISVIFFMLYINSVIISNRKS